MSLRSLLALGLLAAQPIAAVPASNKDCTAKTVTVTKTHWQTTVTKYQSTPYSSSTSRSSSSSTSSSHSSSSSASSSRSSSTSASSSRSSSTSSAGISSITSASISYPATVDPNPSTTLTATATGLGLNDYAKQAGKLYMGTAADIPGTPETTDPYYLAEFNNAADWGGATPANAMKWVFTEPEQGVFNYTEAEIFLAAAQGKIIRCHNLNWYNQLPAWVTGGSWTKETLSDVLTNHVTNLVEYFGDRCYAWDVVNEALNDTSTGNLNDQYTWRQDIWYEIIGPDYINVAFSAAQAAVEKNNLAVKLYYNDYNIESPNNKSIAAQALVQRLKNAGIQIDGAGLQAHFIVGGTPSLSSQTTNMEAFAALGVEVAITELDIRTTTPATEAAQRQQVQDYKTTIQACADVEACVGVTVWDFDDEWSWIPSTFAGQGYGDLFFQPNGTNTPLVRKAAYDGVIAGWTNSTVVI